MGCPDSLSSDDTWEMCPELHQSMESATVRAEFQEGLLCYRNILDSVSVHENQKYLHCELCDVSLRSQHQT